MSQDWSLTPAAATPPPQIKGKGMIWTGAILLVVGMVLVVAGIVGVIASAASLINGFGSPVTTPTTVSRTFDAGTTYAVYELSGRGSGSGTQEDPLLATVSPSDISVSGPGGISVPVKDPGSTTQTFTNNGREYFAVATFDAPTTGSYQVSITTEGAQVLVAPSLTSFGRSFAWIGAIGLGGLLALLGLILLIVGIVRRSSSKKRAAYAAGAPVAPSYPGQYVAPAAAATAVAAPVAPAPAEPAPQSFAPVTPAEAAAPVEAAAAAAAAPEVQSFAPVTPAEPAAVAPDAAAPAAPVEPVAAPAAPAAPAPPAAALPPAGWYPDPGRPGGQRYWDGAQWTEHTA
ncbi:MAG: DUF2510 domain-containing protein [Candidatus Nanopelagicales bacterium]